MTARTVLYIEDNPANVALVEAILARRPEVTLLVATTGARGLQLARERRPALVLLDLNLPDISGEEVLRRLRGDAATAGMEIVMLSADATAGQVERLRDAGADDYLTKPFGLDRFLAVIDRSASPAAGGGAARDALEGGPLTTLRSFYPDDAALRAFVVLLLEDAADRMDVLTSAARAGDADAVWQAAHRLRGSFGLTGADRIMASLADIEACGRDGEVPDERAIAALEQAHREVADALARAIG